MGNFPQIKWLSLAEAKSVAKFVEIGATSSFEKNP